MLSARWAEWAGRSRETSVARHGSSSLSRRTKFQGVVQPGRSLRLEIQSQFPIFDFMEKTCNSCGCQFIASRSKDAKCPECKRSYDREWYAKNSKRLAGPKSMARGVYARSVQDIIMSYLSGKACIDCGEDDPIVLEFDHREGSGKRFGIGDAAKRSRASVIDELGKCDIRCANCHRRKTALERGWYRGFYQGVG